MSTEIRIADLAHPVLTETQRAALAYGETLTLDFTREAILDDAKRMTGLSDFGREDFLVRLDLLVDEWGRDPGVTALARLGLRNKLVQFAVNRLLIHDLLGRHPEILEVEIRRPIIVVGLPRSGTTHLVNLMAADSRLRSLPLWESYEPVPMPGEPPAPDGADPRYARCAQAWETMQKLTPHLAAMHPMDPDHIHEELELMGPDFASYNFEWLAVSPRWRDHYYATDQTPHYEYMKNVLRILQWYRGPDRWVLKCPQHLEQLPVLRRVFPDATIAVTHRDPVSVIQSAVTMLAYGQRINRRRVDLGGLLRYWSDRVEHLLRACVCDRTTFPPAQSVDVGFHELMADTRGMVERIFATAGLEMTGDARTRLERFIATHPRDRHGRVVYDLQGDFGVSPRVLRERFRFYLDAFSVRAEG
jgi:hypothetical protein